MSELSNWIALNKQVDTLPPEIARSVLNLIRAFEALVKRLGFNETVTLFDNHLVDYHNPHQVRFANLGQMTSDSLWDYYPLIGRVILENKEALAALTDQDPPLALGIMRQDILNTDYWYQDGVGSIGVSESTPAVPFFTISDPTPISKTTPFYQTSTYIWDFLLNQNTGYQVSIPNVRSISSTILFSCNLASGGVDRVWTLSLGSFIEISLSGIDKTLRATINPNAFTNLTTNTLVIPLTTNGGTYLNEFRGAVTLTPTSITLYGISNGRFTSTTLNVSPLNPLLCNSLQLSHGVWDLVSDETATKSVGCYPQLTDLREIETRLNTL